METSGVVGSIAGLWRFPVKSMRGEQLEEAGLTERGLVGDRAYALIDTDTGKVVSAKSVRLFPDLLGCRACFPRTRRFLLRPVPGVRADDLHPRLAERAKAAEPHRPAPVPDERDRWN